MHKFMVRIVMRNVHRKAAILNALHLTRFTASPHSQCQFEVTSSRRMVFRILKCIYIAMSVVIRFEYKLEMTVNWWYIVTVDWSYFDIVHQHPQSGSSQQCWGHRNSLSGQPLTQCSAHHQGGSDHFQLQRRHQNMLWHLQKVFSSSHPIV